MDDSPARTAILPEAHNSPAEDLELARRRSQAVGYLLDADDRIISVNGGWMKFANANGASHLTPHAVCGQVLWNFIGSSSIVHLHRVLVNQVRATRQPVECLTRCDSPTVRRTLRLTIRPAGGQRVAFHNVVEREDPVITRPGAREHEPLVLQCSLCFRFNLRQQWVELEEFAASGIFARFPRLLSAYGICPNCRDKTSEVNRRVVRRDATLVNAMKETRP